MVQSILPQVKNIVFLMLENRSLDNVLGWLYQGAAPAHVFPAGSDPAFDGLVAGRFSNPSHTWDGSVKTYPVVPVPGNLGADQDRVPAYDPTEEMKGDGSWNGVLNQMFGNQDIIKGLPTKASGAPAMKGFLQDYYARYMLTWQGLDILWTYTPKQLPVINGLARSFAVSDRWFCSVPTQTNPNRAYSICGTSLGRESNMNLTAIEQFDAPTVFNCLGAAGKSWGLYSSGTWVQGKSYTEYTFPQISQAGHGEIGDIAKFFAHASAGSLPQFTYLEPAWGGGKGAFYKQGTDYHPPTHLAPGEQFLAKVYQAVRNGPQWGQTLFIVTFDEHGGTYDHVAPPWGATNPDGHNGADGFKFDLFGARVPTLLVSPFVQPGTVFRAPAGSTVPFDHTSFIKTLLLWAGVDPASAQLGRRMPLAPTFEGVLEDQPVNTAAPELKEAPPLVASAAPASPSDAVAAVVQPLDALFTGVGAAAVRAILGRNQGLAGIQADLQRYRQDPEEFETSLGAGVHTFRAGV